MKRELIFSELNRGAMPKAVQQDQYFVANDYFVKKQIEIAQEIRDQAGTLEPWQAKCAKLMAEGKSVNSIAKTLKKSQRDIKAISTYGPFTTLVGLYQALDIYADGPNEILRKQMLWRIAVDNEKDDPKEARAALAELNRMEAPKGGGNSSGPVQIIITSDSLQKGPLDG